MITTFEELRQKEPFRLVIDQGATVYVKISEWSYMKADRSRFGDERWGPRIVDIALREAPVIPVTGADLWKAQTMFKHVNDMNRERLRESLEAVMVDPENVRLDVPCAA